MHRQYLEEAPVGRSSYLGKEALTVLKFKVHSRGRRKKFEVGKAEEVGHGEGGAVLRKILDSLKTGK